MKLLFAINLICLNCLWQSLALLTTCDRVKNHGYPCSRYSMATKDGFKLTLFRINNASTGYRPAVLVQHGLISSSDCFVINDAENILVYQLYEEGYDVWIANSRGNDYSQEGIPRWDFSWHEMGIYDEPAIIDYILLSTGQTSVHYVGHSQGGSIFFVMASLAPNYVKKLKSIHLFAPAVFLTEVTSLVAKFFMKISQYPSAALTQVATVKFIPGVELVHSLMPVICQNQPVLKWCENLYFLLFGGPSSCTNDQIMHEILATHPSSCSLRQLIHYGQIMNSQKFGQFDYGPMLNLRNYGSLYVKEYPLQNVPRTQPIHVYGALNDDVVSVSGLKKLAAIIPNIILEFIAIPDFLHMDFCMAVRLPEILHNCVVDRMNKVEGKPYKTGRCNLIPPP